MSKLLPLVLATLVYSAPAHADLIVIDPNTYAVGTDLSSIFENVTLSILTPTRDPNVSGPAPYNPTTSPVIVGESPTGAVWGSPHSIARTNVITDLLGCYSATQVLGYGSWCNTGQWVGLELLFDTPVDFVQAVGAYTSDGPAMVAYDALGAVVASCYTPWDACSVADPANSSSFGRLNTVSVSTAERSIARVVVGGLAGPTSIIQASYSVPEPGTLSMMLIGGVAAFSWRRRKSPR